MGIAEILALIPAFFKFFDQIVWFVKKLQDTPEEKRQKIVVQIGEESHAFAKTGRPKWG